MYLLRINVVEVVLYELDCRREVGLVELVRDVPADRAELATFLDGGVEERDGVQQWLPLRHRHDVDEVLTNDAVRPLQPGLDALRRLGRVLDRRLQYDTQRPFTVQPRHCQRPSVSFT